MQLASSRHIEETNRIGRIVLGEAQERDLLVLPRRKLARQSIKGGNTLTPAITTSYFSSVPVGMNCGLRRGMGGEKDGRTRRSREEVEYSVKTGIVYSLRGATSKCRQVVTELA